MKSIETIEYDIFQQKWKEIYPKKEMFTLIGEKEDIDNEGRFIIHFKFQYKKYIIKRDFIFNISREVALKSSYIVNYPKFLHDTFIEFLALVKEKESKENDMEKVIYIFCIASIILLIQIACILYAPKEIIYILMCFCLGWVGYDVYILLLEKMSENEKEGV